MSHSLQSHRLAPQAPLSIGFPGKNTGAGCRFLLQGIFQTQRRNPCVLRLLPRQVASLPLTPPGRAWKQIYTGKAEEVKVVITEEKEWGRGELFQKLITFLGSVSVFWGEGWGGLVHASCRIFLDQGLSQYHLKWKHNVLTIGPPRKCLN